MATPRYIFGGETGETPESLARKRQVVQALLERAVGGVPQNLGEGIAALGQALSGRFGMKALERKEAAGRASASEAFDAALSGYGGGVDAVTAAMAPEATAPAYTMPAGPDPVSPAGGAMAARGGPVVDPFDDIGPRLMADLTRDFELAPHQAAGLVGNLAHESGGFKSLQEIDPTVPGSRGGYGYAQWTGPRRKAFEEWSAANGVDPTSYDANYGFLKHELTNTPEGNVLGSLRGAPDAATAASVIEQQFLRPGIPHSESRLDWTNRAMGFAPQELQVAGADPTAVPMPASDPHQVVTEAMLAHPSVAAEPAPVSPAVEQVAQAQMALDPALLEAASNPWMTPTQREILGLLVQQQLKANQPMSPLDRLALEKGQLEIDALRNPTMDPGEAARLQLDRERFAAEQGQPQVVGGRLVGPDGRVVYEPPADPADLMNVSPGTTVFDPITRQPVFSAPMPDEDLMSPDALAQQLQLRTAGRAETNVNIDQKAEGAFEKAGAEALAKRYAESEADGMNARADLAMVQELRGLAGQIGTGGGAAIKAFAGNWGIELGEDVGDIQAFEAIVNKLVPTQRPPGSGTMSDRDVSLFKSSLPRLINTPEGNTLVLDTMEAMSRYRMAQGDIAAQVLSGDMTRQDGLKAMRELPDPLEAFREWRKRGADATAGKKVQDLSDEELLRALGAQ